MSDITLSQEFIFYSSEDGTVKTQVIVDKQNETIWATQKEIAELFNVTVQNVSYHLSNVYSSGELSSDTTIKKILNVVQRGFRGRVQEELTYYNLDVIISVGYRVNSQKATQFRIWATKVLKEYMVKGFALDDERLKKGGNVFGKEYFNELLERVQGIRASERLFYQKLTDLFAESVDYDPKSEICRDFYASIQNKLEYAVIGKTAQEIIVSRIDSKHQTLGLLSWKTSKKGGKIMLSDAKVAKNYMSAEELSELNTVVSLCLDSAELAIKRRKLIKMSEWVEIINALLTVQGYSILKGKGSISKEQAEKIVKREYEIFKPIQDKRFKSDFDKLIEKTLKKGSS